MTERARRLNRFLTDEFGWETHGEGRQCKACERWTYDVSHVYCASCGKKLPKKSSEVPQTLAELEQAIRYALKEDE